MITDGDGLNPTPETLRIVQHMASVLALSSQTSYKDINPHQRPNGDDVLIRVQRHGMQSVFASWIKLFSSLLIHPFRSYSDVQNPDHSEQTNNSPGAYRIVCPSLFRTVQQATMVHLKATPWSILSLYCG